MGSKDYYIVLQMYLKNVDSVSINSQVRLCLLLPVLTYKVKVKSDVYPVVQWFPFLSYIAIRNTVYEQTLKMDVPYSP